MRLFINTLLVAAATLLATACKPDAVVPAESVDLQAPARIYPDYSNVVIPPNIAPLNFMVREEGSEFVCRISSTDGRNEVLTAAGEDGKFRIDSLEWRGILQASRGNDLEVNVYARRGDKWMHYPPFHITVATDEIDPYLTYRLIEPSYELYRQLGIYERCLTNFHERPIYENGDTYSLNNNHCINCHTPQQYGTTGSSLFHVRGDHGGTIFMHGDRVERINMKNDSTLGNAVYPAWHPAKPWIVFSSNLTGQAFHIMNSDKIEVIDYGSDLVFYDVEENRISNITKTTVEMETFPTWAPDGKRLYYCSATFTPLGEVPDTLKGEDHTLACSDSVISHYNQVRYRLMTLDFDPSSRRFSAPHLLLDCPAMAKSATLPRVSPDGRWLLFTMGDYGQFHIWHKTSDLYIMDLHAVAQGISPAEAYRPLEAANSNNVESYHTWSSNGRWIVFSSRRDDGSYTRPYICYFDAEGKDYKPFLLPQEDPEMNLSRTKSYNIPEFAKHPVKASFDDIRRAVYDDEAVRRVKTQ